MNDRLYLLFFLVFAFDFLNFFSNDLISPGGGVERDI